MYFRRILIRIRIALILCFVIGFMAVVGGLLYLNHQGLNEDVRKMISNKLAERGMHVDFDSLSYRLTTGLVAENVTIYADESKRSKIAQLPEIHINVDKTKLMRGIQKINSIALQDCQLEIPLDPERPNQTRVVIKKINGKILFPDNSTIITKQLTAEYEGIGIEFTGNLWQGKKPASTASPEAAKRRALAYESFLNRLAHWRWPADSPPQIKLFAEGDIYAPQFIKLEFSGQAKQVTRKKFTMKNLVIEGDLSHNLVTVESLQFENVSKGEQRQAKLVGDFDLGSYAGRFQIESDIHLKEFARELFDEEILSGTQFRKSHFTANGSFKLEKSMKDAPYASALPAFLTPYKGNQISLMGRADLQDFSHLGSKFTSITSDFSYDAGDLYLDDLYARSPHGFLKARLLIKDQNIRFDAESTLPVRAYRPFFKEQPDVAKHLAKVTFGNGASCYFKSSGTINANDLTDWNASGEVKLTKLTYDGEVSVESIASKFTWKEHFLNSEFLLDGLEHGDTKVSQVTTKLKWHQGIISLQDTEIADQDILIEEINSNLKEVDGKLAGNLTIKNAAIKGFTFDQLDTSMKTDGSAASGKVHFTNPAFKDNQLDQISADVHYDKELKFDNLIIKHKSGQLTGSIHKREDRYVYYDLLSTLDPRLYVPLAKYEETKKLILKGEYTDKSTHKLTVKGRINIDNPKDWAAVGQADITNFQFNNVPLTKLSSKYDINRERMVMDDATFGFDYSNYSMKHSAGNKVKTGELKVDRVVVDIQGNTVSLDNIQGQAYPAPVARMFNAKTADHLEQYKFFAPPIIRAGGSFDCTVKPEAEQKLDFQCNLACPSGSVMYSVLDGNLLLKNFKANVHIKKDSVTIDKISTQTLRGKMQGKIIASIHDDKFSGDLSFLKLNFRDIGITYNFDEIPQGELTGKIKFSGTSSDLRNFNATGNISLDKGDIFSAPILGPISYILSPLLPKANMINEQLTNLSANFTINKGVLRTDNLHSLTSSMTFAGAGWIDLKTEKMDLTIRINYRGILGLTMQLGAEVVRLPLHMLRALFLNKKPEVAGLLQVRGTGTYKKPKWRPVQFDVERGFKGKLFNPPKAVIVP